MISEGESHEPDGALDSACGGTLAGHEWLQQHIQLVLDKGLGEFVSIVSDQSLSHSVTVGV